MRTFFIYLFLEYKKSAKVLLKSTVSLLLAAVLLLGAAAVLSHVFFGSRMLQAIDVGVAVPEGEKETKAVLRFLSAMESAEAVCNFRYFPENEAMEKLYEGEVQAVIVLPESLYEDMYSGEKGRIAVYLPEDPPFRVQVFRELLADGVSLLTTAEAGVLAASDLAGADAIAYGERDEIGFPKMKPYEAANFISYEYIQCALGRDNMFDEYVYSPLGQMDLYQYYFAAAVSVLLLMSGLNYSFLYQGNSRAVEQKLRVMGLGTVKVSLIKILVMANASWLLAAASYLAGCLFSRWGKFDFIWFHGSALLLLIPVSIGAAFYFHAVYSVFGKGMQGAVFLLSVNAVMVLCSGVVIPLAYLPEAVRRVGQYLPLNFLRQYCAEVFF
ncbi:ABC transporter permease [Schaedlerella sp.]|uniref:ABC transporter permease n=1 Tax=Schaedlerella sp. TaxID=2676057 RepID=UPI003746F75C